jgi:hypothetical protein
VTTWGVCAFPARIRDKISCTLVGRVWVSGYTRRCTLMRDRFRIFDCITSIFDQLRDWWFGVAIHNKQMKTVHADKQICFVPPVHSVAYMM